MEMIWVRSLASFIISEDDRFRLPTNGQWMSMWFRKLTGDPINMEKISTIRFTFKDDHLVLNVNVLNWEGNNNSIQYSTYPNTMQEFLVRMTKSIFEDK